MNGIDYRGAARRSPSQAQVERDAALDRVARTRRWMIAGAAALTAAFAALVSVVAPGRTSTARAHGNRTADSRTSTPASSAQMPPLASPSQLGLQGPDQPPEAASVPPQAPSNPSQTAPAPATAPAVSGGS